MNNKEIQNIINCLNEMKIFAENYPNFLSYNSLYAKGYKDGQFFVHDRLIEILEKYNLN